MNLFDDIVAKKKKRFDHFAIQNISYLMDKSLCLSWSPNG